MQQKSIIGCGVKAFTRERPAASKPVALVQKHQQRNIATAIAIAIAVTTRQFLTYLFCKHPNGQWLQVYASAVNIQHNYFHVLLCTEPERTVHTLHGVNPWGSLLPIPISTLSCFCIPHTSLSHAYTLPYSLSLSQNAVLRARAPSLALPLFRSAIRFASVLFDFDPKKKLSP